MKRGMGFVGVLVLSFLLLGGYATGEEATSVNDIPIEQSVEMPSAVSDIYLMKHSFPIQSVFHRYIFR